MGTRILLTVAWLLLAGSAFGIQLKDDPGVRDTLTVDSVRVLKGSPGILPVWFVNDQALLGIEITLAHADHNVHIDSFSFVGGRAEHLSVKGTKVEDTVFTAFAFPTSEPPIPPGRGLLGRVYYSCADSVAVQTMVVDSITIAIELIEHSTWFTDSELEPFAPIFIKGYLDIQDSCCQGLRGNVDGSAEDGIDISDLTTLIGFLFIDLNTPLICPEEADVDVSSEQGSPDISDLTLLVSFLFIDPGTMVLAPCQGWPVVSNAMIKSFSSD